MSRLPIDDIIPRLLHTLKDNQAVVVLAPPGAGKTTRVPLALLEAPWLAGSIVMQEPRRLAASNAARWMARSLGEEVGQRVGYNIRFDRKVSKDTQVEVVTEGILARRLHADPLLEKVGVVIFDEFHERSLNSDLSLALCRDVQLGLREDLRLVVMSATMDGEAISRLLGNAPILASEGRMYPVDVEYLPADPEFRSIVEACRATVIKALRETTGDILVFLPGAAEIRRCKRLLEEASLQGELLICPLYGDLPFAEQERAIMPSSRRKVVLATNIAETSLTIEGVGVVVDSGYARQLRFDPATGLNRLVTERISAASAEQRKGRAGRLGPGRCYRLWTQHVQRSLLPFTPPEIKTADLAQLALDLSLWGIVNPESLAWLDLPPAAALAEGRKLLADLGALDDKGSLTSAGKELAELPLHPRLAHMLLMGSRRGMAEVACDVAALLAERDVLRRGADSGEKVLSECDMLDRIEALDRWRAGGGVAGNVDAAACRSVDRVSRQLQRIVRASGNRKPLEPEMPGLLLSWAYPDRIGMLREAGTRRYLLANGQGGKLSERSSLHEPPFMVAFSMEGGERGDGVIHLASSLTRQILLREYSARCVRNRVLAWDVREGRVVCREELKFGALVLESRPASPTGDELLSALLAGLAASGGQGLSALGWNQPARQFLARARFLARHAPELEWPVLTDEHLMESLSDWLGPYLGGVRSLSDLKNRDILPAIKGKFERRLLLKIDEEAPTHIIVPSGSRIMLDYDVDDPPVLAVKLQELFGLADTPRVAWGRVPVVVHLLSPAKRPIQVTRDLKGFWERIYPEVKKELKGRYPKHPWPDDPWSTTPTRHTKKKAGL